MPLIKLQEKLLQCFKSEADKEKLKVNSMHLDALKTELNVCLFELAASLLIDNIYELCATETLIIEKYKNKVMSRAKDFLLFFAMINENFKTIIDEKLPRFCCQQQSVYSRPELSEKLQDDLKNNINYYYYKSFLSKRWLSSYRFLTALTLFFNKEEFKRESYEDCIAIVKVSTEELPMDTKIQQLLNDIIEFENTSVVYLALDKLCGASDEGSAIQSPSIMKNHSSTYHCPFSSYDVSPPFSTLSLVKGAGTVQSTSLFNQKKLPDTQELQGVLLDLNALRDEQLVRYVEQHISV